MHFDDIPESAELLLEIVTEYGPTGEEYLVDHFARFRGTVINFLADWPLERGSRVLDVGAHWLHQAVLLARCGFSVTAADFPATLGLEGIQSLAKAHGISLLLFEEISTGKAFADIPDSSMDVVFFTEILEHITFNPVEFWKAIYRVLKPGGRIVLTTPNYYRKGGHAWQMRRFLSGSGAGIHINEILGTQTYGHHWKEFSRKEVSDYFCSLSPDFVIHRAVIVDHQIQVPKSFVNCALSFLLPQIYVEIDLPAKNAGVVVKPGW